MRVGICTQRCFGAGYSDCGQLGGGLVLHCLSVSPDDSSRSRFPSSQPPILPSSLGNSTCGRYIRTLALHKLTKILPSMALSFGIRISSLQHISRLLYSPPGQL